MSCTSICKLIPHFYSVAEQQWVQAPEHIKHCLLNRLFAFHAVNFFWRCGTSASKLLWPSLPHERSTMARVRGHRHQRATKGTSVAAWKQPVGVRKSTPLLFVVAFLKQNSSLWSFPFDLFCRCRPPPASASNSNNRCDGSSWPQSCWSRDKYRSKRWRSSMSQHALIVSVLIDFLRISTSNLWVVRCWK